MNYSDVASVDTYALSKGEDSFLTCDDTGVTAAVNAVGGYTAASTSLVLDGLSSASYIKKNHLLYIGSEYLRVTAVTYSTVRAPTVTVLRGQYGTTAAIIADDAPVSVRNMLKVRLLNTATRDIVDTHKQYLTEDLWMSQNEWLIEVEQIQAIHLSKYIKERETAERIKTITEGNFSDGVLSIGAAAGGGLCKEAASLMSHAMKWFGVSRNEWGRA